jgi:hypothetical protein
MWNLAQYNYNYQTTNSSGSTAIWLIYLILYLVFAAGVWKVFVKAGQEGWKGIIPIYNYVVMFRLVGMSGWYTLLMLVPVVNIVVGLILYNKLAKNFGYGIGMAILMLLGIGFLVLGFGKAKYHATAPAVTAK